ncbi:MAG: 20, gp20, partial [Sphingomonadales bacterium]|nr:20, gp20 [Sphingomonadales bacterium]
MEIASAYVSLLPSARGFGPATEKQLGPEVKGAGKRLGSGFGKMFALAGGVIAAAGIGSFLKGSIDEAREAQKVGAATEAILKATGGAAKLTAKQIGNLASSLSAKTAVDDEQIQAGANLLLTFKNVKREGKGLNDVFGRATAAGLDLAAAGFGSVEGNAKQLGKALNDPLKGISALAKAGVTFTDGQKDQIEGFVEANDLLSAQKIILGEVEKQVGGTAAATATSGEKAAVAFGNLKEQVGTALLPVIDKVASFLSEKVIPAVSDFVAGIQDGSGAGGQFAALFRDQILPVLQNLGAFLVGTVVPAVISLAAGFVKYKDFLLPVAAGITAIIAAIKIWTVVTKAFAVVQGILDVVLAANPIGLVILAIVGLVAALAIVYTKSATFRAICEPLFAVLKKVWGVLMDNKQAFLLLLGPIGLVAAAFITAYKKSDAFRAIADSVFGVLKKVTGFIAANFIPMVLKIGSTLLRMASFGIKAFTFLLDAAFACFEGILSAADKGLGWIPGLGGKIHDANEAFSNFRESTINALDSVAQKTKNAADALDKLAEPRSTTFTTTYINEFIAKRQAQHV